MILRVAINYHKFLCQNIYLHIFQSNLSLPKLICQSTHVSSDPNPWLTAGFGHGSREDSRMLRKHLLEDKGFQKKKNMIFF